MSTPLCYKVQPAEMCLQVCMDKEGMTNERKRRENIIMWNEQNIKFSRIQAQDPQI